MTNEKYVILTAAEAADMLDCSVSTLYRRWRGWGLRGFYTGNGRLWFSSLDIERWIEKKVNG